MDMSNRSPVPSVQTAIFSPKESTLPSAKYVARIRNPSSLEHNDPGRGRNQQSRKARRDAYAICHIGRRLMKMTDIESASIASCLLRAAQVESVIDSPSYPLLVRTFFYRLPITVAVLESRCGNKEIRSTFIESSSHA